MRYLIDLSLLRRNRNFCLLYVGQFVSFLGTMITRVSLPYQIYHETHSTLWIGLLSLCELLPLLVTALLGGVFADRHHRQRLLFIAEILLAMGCLLLIYNAMLTPPRIWVIFVAGTLMSAIDGLHRPSRDSLIQQIVAKEDFSTVGELSTFMYSVGMIAGPAVAGLIIAHFGLVVTFSVDFASYFISLMTLVMMKGIPRPQVTQDLSTFSSLKKGLQYAVSKQELLGTYALDFVAMVFGMPMALFPAIAESFGGVKTLGLLYAAPAVGALIISFCSGWAARVKHHGVAIAIAALLWGIGIIFFGLSKNLWLALFFLSMAGAFDAISGIFRQTMWNTIIPNHYRGRLAGIEMIGYLSGPKLGDTEAGLVAAAFGVTASVVSGGVFCIVGVMVCCYYLPRFWQYQAPQGKKER
ncbi:MAG: entS [Gammaproteobacteria bacterium]|jgi:MFS family permease|nr:entS [Gammaproteobacteria bacterium]